MLGTRSRVGLLILALTAGWLPGHAPRAATSEFTYVTVSDGVPISIQVVYPEGFVPARKYPTVFEMDGYDGSSGLGGTREFQREYVSVRASARGSGCSGGKFDLLSERTARDGYDIIESWVVRQRWSNGKVGIIGHSYPGLTGFQIAGLAPPHVRAVAVSGLIDDYYRGIFYMGGIPNPGFPLLWEGAYRPATDAQATIPRLTEDPICRANIAQRKTWNVVQAENIADAYTNRQAVDGSWAVERSPANYAPRIRAPIQIGHQYQDEQTGPRAPALFERLSRKVPRRLIMSNGKHNLDEFGATKEWLDCWILRNGKRCGAVTDPKKRVMLYFETIGHDVIGSSTEDVQKTRPYYSSDFPLPETRWARLYLRGDGRLGWTPQGGDGAVSYASTTTGRQTVWDVGLGGNNARAGRVTYVDGPDAARWEMTFDRATAIAGPMNLTMYATSTAPDTDFFVDLLDVDVETGETSYIQRGMLRASHRAIDLAKSDRVKRGRSAGTIYRHHLTHLDPTPITPLLPYQYEIEIYPVGHVFRPGHKLVLLLHAPPLSDPVSLYAWSPEQPPAVNTVLQYAGMRSNLLVPLMPTIPPIWRDRPRCGRVTGEYCFTPIDG